MLESVLIFWHGAELKSTFTLFAPKIHGKHSKQQNSCTRVCFTVFKKRVNCATFWVRHFLQCSSQSHNMDIYRGVLLLCLNLMYLSTFHTLRAAHQGAAKRCQEQTSEQFTDLLFAQRKHLTGYFCVHRYDLGADRHSPLFTPLSWGLTLKKIVGKLLSFTVCVPSQFQCLRRPEGPTCSLDKLVFVVHQINLIITHLIFISMCKPLTMHYVCFVNSV